MNPRLIIITEDRGGKEGVDMLLSAIENGSAPRARFANAAVLLRLPSTTDGEYAGIVPRFLERTRALGLSPMVHGLRGAEIVQHDLDVGVHFPERDWRILSRPFAPRCFISAAVHDEEGAVSAAKLRPSGVLLGPIFRTPDKGIPLGLTYLRDVRRALHREIMLFALGGVDQHNVESTFDSGADGVAVIRAVTDTADPSRAAATLLDAIAPLTSRSGVFERNR